MVKTTLCSPSLLFFISWSYWKLERYKPKVVNANTAFTTFAISSKTLFELTV
jgi:hypothetical protein